MPKILSVSHPKAAYYLVLSKLFERAGYYGFRSIIILFLINGALKIPRTEASLIYGFFIGAAILMLLFGGIVGAVSKKANKIAVLGLIFQIVGTSLLAIPIANYPLIIIGLIIIFIGTGLFDPNIKSVYGMKYRSSDKLLDSGFLLLSLGTNIGSMLGPVLVGLLSVSFGYVAGFGATAVLFAFSLLFMRIVADPTSDKTSELIDHIVEVPKIKETKRLKFSLSQVVGLLVFIILFHLGQDFIEIVLKEQLFSNQTFLFNVSWLYTYFTPIVAIPIGIVFFISWNFRFVSTVTKLLISFSLLILSILFILLAWEYKMLNDLGFYLCLICLLEVARTIISPILFSSIVRYTNPRFYPLCFAGINVLFYLINFIGIPFLYLPLEQMSFLILLIISIVVVFTLLWYKRSSKLKKELN